MPGTFDIRCLYPSPLIASGRGGWTGTSTFVFLYRHTKQSCMNCRGMKNCICDPLMNCMVPVCMRPSDWYSPAEKGQPLAPVIVHCMNYYDGYRYERWKRYKLGNCTIQQSPFISAPAASLCIEATVWMAGGSPSAHTPRQGGGGSAITGTPVNRQQQGVEARRR